MFADSPPLFLSPLMYHLALTLSLSHSVLLATVALCQVRSTALPLTAVLSRLSVALKSPSLSV